MQFKHKKNANPTIQSIGLAFFYLNFTLFLLL